MNILILSKEYPPDIGGAGVMASHYFEELTKAGYQVHVKSQTNYDIPNFDYSILKFIIEVLIRFINSKLWFISLGSNLNLKFYNNIILNDTGSLIAAGLLFKKKTLKKCICVFHGETPETLFYSNKTPKSFKKKLINFCSLRAIKNSNKIITVSHSMKLRLIEKAWYKNDFPKIVVVKNKVSTEKFFCQKVDGFYNKFAIPNKSQVILSVSRIVREKGFFKMLDIFEKVFAKNKNVFWVIIGEGRDEPEFRQCIYRRVLVRDNIRLIGKIPRDELRYYYSNANLFWLHSECNEAFGLVYLEAQQCGCPILAKDDGGVSEAINLNLAQNFLAKDDRESFKYLYEFLSRNEIPYSKPFPEACASSNKTIQDVVSQV